MKEARKRGRIGLIDSFIKSRNLLSEWLGVVLITLVAKTLHKQFNIGYSGPCEGTYELL